MSDSIHVRNAKALAEAARADRLKSEQLTARVAHLENQVAMLRQSIEQLTQRITLAFAGRGSGPTSR
jgi:uncharacterized protein YceH (UPF0502 family)